MKNSKIKLASGILACAAGAVLASSSANASLVTGNVSISIDNAAFSNATGGWYIDRYFDSSYNTTLINANTVGGSSDTSNMAFSVNTNATTVFYGSSVNRYLEATTMNTDNLASGQIGLSGGVKMQNPVLGNLDPYDFTLQKIGGVWNLVSHDLFFGGTTFLQLTNANESVSNNQLSLSGDLVFGGGISSTTFASVFGLTWSTFLGVTAPNEVVGTLNLTVPAAVPVPGALWLFGGGLLGICKLQRRKLIGAA